MSHFPFPQRRPNPKRDQSRRIGTDRVRLDRFGLEALRIERWELDGRSCVDCGKPLPIDGDVFTRAHFAHNDHGPRKTDTIDGGKTKCYDCHIGKDHNAGGKPCNRRPGRTMKQSEALAYLKSDRCFCDKAKRTLTAFCDNCKALLSDQQRFDLEHVTHKEFLKLMADCELTILAETAKMEIA